MRNDCGDCDHRNSQYQGILPAQLALRIPVSSRGALSRYPLLAFSFRARLVQRGLFNIAPKLISGVVAPPLAVGTARCAVPTEKIALFEERLIVRAQIDFQAPCAAVLLDEIPIGIRNGIGLK